MSEVFSNLKNSIDRRLAVLAIQSPKTGQNPEICFQFLSNLSCHNSKIKRDSDIKLNHKVLT